jgi:hypothetical protein
LRIDQIRSPDNASWWDDVKMAKLAQFICFVADQGAATAFWSRVLQCSPSLEEPGMTEFTLADGAVLGLMPESGIRALLGKALPDPAGGRGILRSELYLVVEDPSGHHTRALACGARELSPLAQRPWGDQAAYSLDPDGHVIAFASRPLSNPGANGGHQGA